MPDQEGRLSPAEMEYILNWVQRQAGGSMPTCPISQHKDWHVSPYVWQALPYPISPSTPLAPQPYPFITLLCMHCGHYLNFNAALMGLYPVTEPPDLTTGDRHAS